MIEQLQQTLHTEAVAVGASEFDPTKAPIVFEGLSLPRAWIWPRIVSMLFPLALIPLAGLFFHRFDRVRTRRTAEAGRRNWWGRIQMLFKPLTRRAVALLLLPARGGSLATAIWTDGDPDGDTSPGAFLAFVGVSVAVLVSAQTLGASDRVPRASAFRSDIVTRDGCAGTSAMLYAAPRLRENLVWWKLGSTCVWGVLFCAVPLVVSLGAGVGRFGAVLGGVGLVSALAASLGVMTRNPKTFIVGFLSFWYVVVNDRGHSPALDFAGFYGTATMRTWLLYGGIALVAVGAAQLAHRWRLARG